MDRRRTRKKDTLLHLERYGKRKYGRSIEWEAGEKKGLGKIPYMINIIGGKDNREKGGGEANQ